MIEIDERSTLAIYEQVVLGIKQDILKGILQKDDKLPSVREMAGRLMINPNTIAKAYKELEAQQVIRTVRGKGTFVNELLQEEMDMRLVKKIQTQLEPLILEAAYGNISEEEMIRWIKEGYEKVGGKRDDC